MALALPYYPSRSKEYQRIWSRCRNKSARHVIVFDREEYQKKYYQRPLVKERNRRSRLRLAVVNLLGAECVKCGMRDLRCLQLDHINGGGNTDNVNRTSSSYNKLLKNPQELFMKLQLLCANCNWIKRYEEHEAPHQFPYKVIVK